MSKIKTNYLAGKYELTKETGVNGATVEGEKIYLNLTAAQAKALMSNGLYLRLGFNVIEFIGAD